VAVRNHILVTGPHRSGTTWVGNTVCQEHSVSLLHEPFNADPDNHRRLLQLDTWFVHADSAPGRADISASFDRILHSRFPEREIYGSEGWSPSVAETAARWVRNRVPLLKTPRILIKDPIALFSADWLYKRYDLQVICMSRAPLGFVGSLKHAGWDFDFTNFERQEALMRAFPSRFAEQIVNACRGEGDLIERSCLLWNILHYTIDGYRRRFPDWLFLKYEDMAASPAEYFEELFGYLGLQISQITKSYIERYSSDRNPAESDDTAFGPRNAAKSLDNWKHRLQPEEVNRVQIRTAEMADRFGY